MNFVVSNYKNIRLKGPHGISVHELYVKHELDQSGDIKNFRNIEVRDLIKKTQAEMEADAEYVDKKYTKYISILSERLNAIHSVEYGERFWKKSLSMAFVRYITIFHDAFMGYRANLDTKRHKANILSASSYYVPSDFEDHRFFFANTDYGREQIFSIYARTFHPGIFSEVDRLFDGGANASDAKSAIAIFRQTLVKFKISFKRWLKKSVVIKRRVVVGIIGCGFSRENYLQLIRKSRLKIFPIDTAVDFDLCDNAVWVDERNKLSQCDLSFDDFDRFFFASVPHCFPMVFLENFDAITAAYKDKIRKYDALRYIVCEAWIGDTRMSLFLALAREFGIKHICNEHNCFFHPYAGSYIEHAVRLSDKFTTLGWCDDKHPNSIQAGSLFLFDIKGDRTKTIPLLYISAPANIYMVHYSSAYGVDGCNAPQHMNFCKSFFTHLSRKALNQMHYRAYPKPDGWLCYEKESYLSEYLCQVRTLSDLSESAKIQMTQSRLVVIDYVATTYIESLVMNIPTVIFCDPEIYYLKDSYSNFFRPLFDAGICHSNPVEAARFVDGILDQPEQWWFSEKVQNGRNSFLQANLGSGEVLIDYLYSLTNEVH